MSKDRRDYLRKYIEARYDFTPDLRASKKTLKKILSKMIYIILILQNIQKIGIKKIYDWYVK